MAAKDDDLIELAGTILDGTPVDWDVEHTGPAADADLIGELRVLSELAHVHRSLHASDGARDHPALGGRDPSALPRWGQLLLLEPVGRGSFGEVFRAWDTQLEREVALKLIDAADHASGSAIEEGRLLARIRHPNVLAVHGAERIGSQIGIWTEFIHGHTLEEALAAEGLFSPAAAAAIGVEICAALSAVHDAGLLHRDVKAQNVMRENGGRIVLMDFGAGAEHGPQSTQRRAIAGTPLYLAPELLDGGSPTPQTDVYSVGVLLFHLLTNAFPVPGESLDRVADRHRHHERLQLPTLRPDTPLEFAAIVARATDPDPAQRFTSIDALARELTAFLAPAAPGAVYRLFHVVPGTSVAAAILVLTVGSAGGLWLRAHRQPAARETASARAMTMRRVDTPPMGLMRAGTPSQDGRLYANVDADLNPIVFDLESGTARRVSRNGQPDDHGEFSAISPDGRQVVYSWWNAAGQMHDLRIAAAGSDEPRILVPPTRDVQLAPVEWSHDGSALLCLMIEPHGRFQGALVSVPSGELHVVSDFGSSQPQHITLSADGRFVAYDAPSAPGSSQHDIFIQAVDGSSPRVAVAHPSDDVSPVWTPDGGRLLFLSNRSGTYDAWYIEVVNGAPVSEPAVLVRNVGQVSIAGFTAAGALYYWRRDGDMDVFTRALAAGAGGASERVLSRVEGVNSAPGWSADGRFFGYLSRRGLGTSAPQTVLVVHPLYGGPERELPIPLSVVSPTAIHWSPDGREVLVGAQDGSGYKGAFVVEVDSGRVVPGVIVPEASPNGIRASHWWIDGRSIAYISGGRIRVRDRGSNNDRVVFDSASEPHHLRIDDFEVSPDHAALAVSGWRDDANPAENVLLVSPLGGPASEVMRTVSPDLMALQAWTPDNRALLVTRRDPRTKSPHALWEVSLDGTRRDTGIRIPGFTHINRLQIDPRGDRIAFTADQVRWDLWVMEHFLPEPRQ